MCGLSQARSAIARRAHVGLQAQRARRTSALRHITVETSRVRSHRPLSHAQPLLSEGVVLSSVL
eukprot:15441282-Alexandrium_andersonii.AAC.1